MSRRLPDDFRRRTAVPFDRSRRTDFRELNQNAPKRFRGNRGTEQRNRKFRLHKSIARFRPSDGRTGFRPPCVARRGPGLLPFDAAEGPPSGCSFARCPPRCIAAAPHGCPGGFLRGGARQPDRQRRYAEGVLVGVFWGMWRLCSSDLCVRAHVTVRTQMRRWARGPPTCRRCGRRRRPGSQTLSPSCGSGGKRGRTSAHVYMMFCAGDDKLVVIDYSTT